MPDFHSVFDAARFALSQNELKTSSPNPSLHGRGKRTARIHSRVLMQRILPLCKGKLEGIVEKLKEYI